MQAYLLDTHTLIWLARSPEKVPLRTRELLSASHAKRFVSAVTAIELTTKYRNGKLPEAETFINDWDGSLSKLMADEIPLTARQGFRAGLLDWAHRDPFDRMLAAQAIDLDIPLISIDPAMSTLPALKVVW